MSDFVIDVNSVEEILQINKQNNSIRDKEFLEQGGQKTVFKCTIDGEVCVLKFCAIKIDENDEKLDLSENLIIRTHLSRIKREIFIMKNIDSPYIVKLGPIDLNTMKYENRFIIYFSEKFIDDKSLDKLFIEHKKAYLQNIKLM